LPEDCRLNVNGYYEAVLQKLWLGLKLHMVKKTTFAQILLLVLPGPHDDICIMWDAADVLSMPESRTARCSVKSCVQFFQLILQNCVLELIRRKTIEKENVSNEKQGSTSTT